MKQLPIYAGVTCSDGACGETTTIVVHPATKDVSYVVVKDHEGVERMVPVEQIVESSADQIRLSCSTAELTAMKPFKETHYIQYAEAEYSAVAPYYGYEMPYVTPMEPQDTVEKVELVPVGDLAIHRGMRVDASDGHVGKLEEFLIDPDSGHISHIVLEKGHLWGKKDVAVPVAEVDFSEGDTVYLKLDKQAVKELPTIPIQRHYKG